MKVSFYSAAILGILLLCYAEVCGQHGDSAEYSKSGWCYPVGKNYYDKSNAGWWLNRDAANYKDTNGEKIYPNNYLKGSYHLGYDMPAPFGTPVRAIADGKVSAVNIGEGWARIPGIINAAVFIKHKLSDGTPVSSTTQHLQTGGGKLLVVVGSKVKAGDIIGYVGHWVYGDHCHIGWYYDSDSPGTRIVKGNSELSFGWGMSGNAFWTSPRKTNGFHDPAELFGPDSKLYPKNDSDPISSIEREAISKAVTEINKSLLAEEATEFNSFLNPYITFYMIAKSRDSSRLEGTTVEGFIRGVGTDYDAQVRSASYRYDIAKGYLTMAQKGSQIRVGVTQKAKAILDLPGWETHYSAVRRRVHQKLEILQILSSTKTAEAVRMLVKCRKSFETPFEDFADFLSKSVPVYGSRDLMLQFTFTIDQNTLKLAKSEPVATVM